VVETKLQESMGVGLMDSSHKRQCLAILALLSIAGSSAPAMASDQATERFLLKGRVTRIHMVMAATTYPMSVDLERKGEVRKAVFKYGQSDGPQLDSYRHEVAAYRLDRALDLQMVPVAVLRNVKTDGAIIEWITPSFTEKELLERGDLPFDSERLADQRAVMSVFDALILNLDRKESDQLITPDDWNLRLIDHSRAFQLSTELPEGFLSHPCRLPRPLLRRLEKLEAQPLTILFDGLLTEDQIQAMLNRRDQILAKIEADRGEMGDSAVFLD